MQRSEPTFDVPFGLLNLQGLMKINKDNVVEQPVFAHSTYQITTTLNPEYSEDFGIIYYRKDEENNFNGKSYQKLYRKVVRWNFGDGTEVDGYSASHTYTIPGKYTISCTFFDINRQGIKNGYKIQVIVNQVIPSELVFDVDESSITDIKCSKIEKIAKIEALLSNNVKDDVDVIVNLQSQYENNSFNLPTGKSDLLGLWTQIQNPPVSDIDGISLKFRRTEQSQVEEGPYYLGVWENTGQSAGSFIKKAVSTNAVIQKPGTTGTWHFDNLQLEGRAIRLQFLTSPTGVWLASPPIMGLYVSDSTDGSYIRSSLGATNLNYIPAGLFLIKGDEYEGKELDNWDDVKDLEFPHLRKYQTFLDKTTEYYYNSQAVYKEYFNPVKKYSPEYESLYGYFDLDGENIVFKCFRVQPYAGKERMKPITINNPNANILEAETFSSYEVIDVSTIDELPEQAEYIGKRAFIDVFYRSDFITPKAVVFFSFDIDNINLHNSIETSTNFLNIPPLGLHFSVLPNDFSDVKFSFTLNGFLTSYEEVDELVELSFVKDYTFDTLLVPYFLSENNKYYIPKDFDFNSYKIELNYQNDNDTTIESEEKGLPYVKPFLLHCKTKLLCDIVLTMGNSTKTFSFDYETKDLKSVVIPTEKYYNQDIKKLIDTYTPHELFQHAPLLKETLVQVFENKNFLNYILTKGVNFFDDNVNFKTNYVNNLLSTLHMMGRDAFEYDQTIFDGVNELRDLCRVLSMNHSQLVGNLIDEAYDIKYTENYVGKHIGDEVLVTDELFVIPENDTVGINRHQKGKITKIKRNDKVLDLIEPTLLVVRDNYTNETKIVNFSDLTPDRIEDDLNVFQIKSYQQSWRWCLLLPDKEDPTGKILQSYYSFYLLNKPDHIIRVGNFLEENTITQEVEEKDIWEEKDGKTFDKIQKVVHNALDV